MIKIESVNEMPKCCFNFLIIINHIVSCYTAIEFRIYFYFLFNHKCMLIIIMFSMRKAFQRILMKFIYFEFFLKKRLAKLCMCVWSCLNLSMKLNEPFIGIPLYYLFCNMCSIQIIWNILKIRNVSLLLHLLIRFPGHLALTGKSKRSRFLNR